ncbi:MAG TPA: GTPase HflX [Candidatus Sulfotelmatobacter sp.]|nr:GTPase HflX [Candidatus Sulfotelmatobacter sp.]
MIELKKTLRVLPIHVINPQANKERAINTGDELESLIKTLGGEIPDRIIQHLEHPDLATYIGKGKVLEVLEKIKKLSIDVVVLNTMAKPRQVHTLKTRFQQANPRIEVWDRMDLILQIFDKHAKTTEAKLQIELARMRYMGPRIYGMGAIMSRQGGGIGTLGVGETNTELMKRHWRGEIKKVTDQLDKISEAHNAQLDQRKRAGFKTVSIVGYTNAGKSSLFNLLSNENVLVENALFVTLDSNVSKIYIPQIEKEILLTDTIGFIRNLPPRLIQAFKSTLMESVHADILLHVIDVSDSEIAEKIHVVNNILHELGIHLDAHMIYVFNKIDIASNFDEEDLRTKYAQYSPIFISVNKQKGIDKIFKTIAKRLEKEGQTQPNTPEK